MIEYQSTLSHRSQCVPYQCFHRVRESGSQENQQRANGYRFLENREFLGETSSCAFCRHEVSFPWTMKKCVDTLGEYNAQF